MSLPDPKAVRVICLDWGGVLLRICHSWEEACAAAGLPLPSGPVDDAIRRRRRALSEDYQLGRLSCADYFEAVSRLSPGYTASDIERLHDAYLIAEYEGALDLSRELASHPRLTGALLSNTNYRHWLRRSEFAAAGTLEHQVASHLHGLAKPDPRFYATLEAAVGASGQAIAFFDDLHENIRGARAMDWQAVRIDPTGDTIAQVRDALRGVLD